MTLTAYARNRMLDLEGISADGLLPHQADALAHGGRQRYSIRRALEMAVSGVAHTGLEAEVDSEIRSRSRFAPGASRNMQGVAIPLDAPIRESFALDTTSGAGGIVTRLAPTLADVLRNKSVLGRMGARFGDWRDGQHGAVSLPAKSAASSATWVVENAAPPASPAMKVGQVTSVPHTTICFADVTRRILKTATGDFPGFVIDDLTTGLSKSIDAAALNGVGVNGQPIGLCQLPWQPFAFASGAPTRAGLLRMMRMAAQSNVDSAPDSAMGWATSSAGREALQSVDMGSGHWCWQSRAEPTDAGDVRTVESVVGVPAISSESVPHGLAGAGLTAASPLAYGNWRNVLVQQYGVVYVHANPYNNDAQGSVRYLASMDVDIMFLYPGTNFVMGFVADLT